VYIAENFLTFGALETKFVQKGKCAVTGQSWKHGRLHYEQAND
jgi:hypothetical protein